MRMGFLLNFELCLYCGLVTHITSKLRGAFEYTYSFTHSHSCSSLTHSFSHIYSDTSMHAISLSLSFTLTCMCMCVHACSPPSPHAQNMIWVHVFLGKEIKSGERLKAVHWFSFFVNNHFSIPPFFVYKWVSSRWETSGMKTVLFKV